MQALMCGAGTDSAVPMDKCRLHYLSRFDVGRRGRLACVAVFEREPELQGGWTGRTNYATTRDDGYIDSKRLSGRQLRYWRWER